MYAKIKWLFSSLSGEQMRTKIQFAAFSKSSASVTLLLSSIAAASLGPPGGVVGHLAIDPTDAMTVYAATSAGVLKTTDGGATWFARNDGVTANPQRIAIDPTNPQTVYLGTFAGQFGDPRLAGIFKSTDGGGHWRQINDGITQFVQVPAVAIDPTDPNVVWATNGGGGVHKTVNGEIWTVHGLQNVATRALVIDLDDSQTVYVSSLVGVFRTRDGGSTWTPIGTVGYGIIALVMDPATRWLYAGTDGGGVFLSQDRGENWIAVSSGLTNLSVNGLLITPDAIYAATSGGVFKSIDRGDSWTDVSHGLSVTFALASAPDDSSTVYVGTSRTIFKTTDAAASDWTELRTGLTESSYQTVFAVAIPRQDSRTLYAGMGSSGVAKSIDGGGTWFDVNNNLPNVRIRTLLIHPLQPEIVYAGAAGGGMGIEKTVTGGETWFASGLDQLYTVALAMDPAAPNTLYASVRELNGLRVAGIYKTTDAGATWWHVLGADRDISAEGVTVDPRNSNIVYAAAAKTPCRQHCRLRGVFKSEDAGCTWAKVNDGLTNLDVTSIVFDPQDSNLLYATTIGSGIFKSQDGARSWGPTGLTEGNVTSVVVDPDHPNILFAGLRELGVFKSINGGNTWEEANRGLDTPDVNSLTMDPNHASILYAATWGGGVFVSYNAAESWE
jgi:photosystem II stability/assembly factor-like uncharacterized protein